MIPKALYLSAFAIGGLLLALQFKHTPTPTIHAGSETTAPAPVVTTTPSTAAQPQDVAVVAMPSETPGSGESLTNEDATYEQRESAIAAVDRPNGVRTSGEFTPPAAPPNPQPARTGGRTTFGCAGGNCGAAMAPRQYQPVRRGLFGGRFRRW